MKRLQLTPKEYHAIRFDRTKLPDLKAAGPVSASILSKSRDVLPFLLMPEKRETADMQWGSLVDSMYLTPKGFWDEYASVPRDAPRDVRSDKRIMMAKKPSQDSIDAMAWWADFDKKNYGKIALQEDDFKDAEAAVDMLFKHPIAQEIHACSEKQVAMFGDSEFFGCQAKGLIDLLPMDGRFSDAIVDLKTTNDPSDHGFLGIIHKFEYQMKMAFYGILAEECGLGTRRRAVFIVQNSSMPFDVHVRELSLDDVDIGRQMAKNRVHMLTRMDCKRPELAYDLNIKTLTMRDWMRNSCLE